MTTATNSNKFNFFVPLDLEKGSDGKGGTLIKIKGVASSEAEDSDGETLIPSGFDFGPLLKSGFLNWNHQAGKSAKAICGEPTSAKIINNGKDFYIEGFLYPNAQGKEVAELAETLEKYSPNRRLGFSIEGQATEKDPMNSKRITKARITGVAITQSPKNPNTLMSIVKGEVDDLYVEDEELTDEEKKKEKEKNEKEGTTEKAMDTVAMSPAMPESVEHKEKPTVGLSLNKSEVYIQIYNRYTTDVIKAKEIFNFISTVNEKLFNMAKGEKITEETLQKSFEILDGLIKGEEENEETNKVKEKDEEEDEEKIEPATSGKEVAEEETEEMKKAKACTSIAKGLLASGMAQGDVVKAMTAVGVNLTMAETACQACISQAEALKENGGAIAAETVPIVKSEESVVLESTSDPDPVLDLVKGLQDSLGEKFGAIGTILKSVVDERDELKETLNTLQKGFNDLSDEFETLAETPAAPKSTRTARAVERFEKGNEEGSEDMYCISNGADVKRLSDRLFGHVEILKSQGKEDIQLEKAVADLEISKSADYTALAPKLRAMGITLVK